MGLMEQEPSRGVWVLWDWAETSPRISMIFTDELLAYRAAQERGYMEKVAFLPYGEEFAPN